MSLSVLWNWFGANATGASASTTSAAAATAGDNDDDSSSNDGSDADENKPGNSGAEIGQQKDVVVASPPAASSVVAGASSSSNNVVASASAANNAVAADNDEATSNSAIGNGSASVKKELLAAAAFAPRVVVGGGHESGWRAPASGGGWGLSLLSGSARVATQLSASDVDVAKQAVWKDNEYLLIETEQRNVLFLGKTRTGKTTAFGMLQDPCYEPERQSLFSDTVGATVQSFSIKDNRSGAVKQYTINVIDTPGVFEVKEIGKQHERRTDDEIVAVITDCLRNEVTKLHVVVMFANVEAGVSVEDVQAIAMFTKLFSHNNNGTASTTTTSSGSSTNNKSSSSSSSSVPSLQKLQLVLCITGADRHELSWQEQVRADLMRHVVLGPLIEENDVKICFVGAVEPQSGRYFNLQHLFQGYAHVYQMRTKLLSMILESSSSRQLLDLDLMTKMKAALLDVMDQMTSNFAYFSAVKDWQQTEVELRMEAHKELGRVLLQCTTFFRVPELLEHFALLSAEARKLHANATIDASVRTQLTWPLALE